VKYGRECLFQDGDDLGRAADALEITITERRLVNAHCARYTLTTLRKECARPEKQHHAMMQRAIAMMVTI
jgi:hypothetical protein